MILKPRIGHPLPQLLQDATTFIVEPVDVEPVLVLHVAAETVDTIAREAMIRGKRIFIKKKLIEIQMNHKTIYSDNRERMILNEFSIFISLSF